MSEHMKTSQEPSEQRVCDGCAKEKELFPIYIEGIGMSWQCRECANVFMEFEKRHQERMADSADAVSIKITRMRS